MSIEVVYKERNSEVFWDYWSKFISARDISPKYLEISLKYNLLVSELGRKLYADKSFVYVVNKIPAACVFLPIEQEGGDFFIQNEVNDGYVDAPLFIDGAVAKKIFALVDGIALEFGVKKIMFAVDPLENNGVDYNYLQRFGFLDASILTFIIDLGLHDLYASSRKGHRESMRKILQNDNFEVFVVDCQSPQSLAFHEEYRELHHKCAGKVTRPKETFDMQYEKLKNGAAVLAGINYRGKSVGYSYFEFSGTKGIYASGVDDPDFNLRPLYHAMVLKGAEHLKDKGVKFIDTGEPSSPSGQYGYYPDTKQLNIGFFKRGFGGDFMNQFRGIKYFSKGEFKKDAEKFVQAYNNYIP
jgi:hypothetical protein